MAQPVHVQKVGTPQQAESPSTRGLLQKIQAEVRPRKMQYICSSDALPGWIVAIAGAHHLSINHASQSYQQQGQSSLLRKLRGAHQLRVEERRGKAEGATRTAAGALAEVD